MNKEEKNKYLAPQLWSVYFIFKDLGQKSSTRQLCGIGLKTNTNRKKQELQAAQAKGKKFFSIKGVF